jgi:hypothetical protein
MSEPPGYEKPLERGSRCPTTHGKKLTRKGGGSWVRIAVVWLLLAQRLPEMAE